MLFGFSEGTSPNSLNPDLYNLNLRTSGTIPAADGDFILEGVRRADGKPGVAVDKKDPDFTIRVLGLALILEASRNKNCRKPKALRPQACSQKP